MNAAFNTPCLPNAICTGEVQEVVQRGYLEKLLYAEGRLMISAG